MKILLLILLTFQINSCTHLTADQQLNIVPIEQKLKDLEFQTKGRIGLSAFNTDNGMRVQYRSEEVFPMCSTFKVMVAAAILKKSMTDRQLLEQRLFFTEEDTKKSGYAPITKLHTHDGMTIDELCAATLQYTDNAASNFLVKQLGGFTQLNAFARSIGDNQFRNDRLEPELSTAIPGDLRDTTTPAAMEKSLHSLLLGNVLDGPHREKLITWLKGNTTGDTRIRAGVPKGWTVGDKTGTGGYGTTNDVGILWPLNGAPIILTIYFTQKTKDAPLRHDVIQSVTTIVLSHFGFNYKE